MNKSSRQYQRGLTTNSFNQDFIYYKYSRQLQKSPRFKKHAQSYQEHEQQTNHSKIQSMKNTLNTLMQPVVSKGFTKSFNRSVMDLPTDKKRNSEIIKDAKSVYEQPSKNVYLNNKLQALTNKLRQIAEKSHFSSVQEQGKREKGKKIVCKTIEDTYVNNMDLIHKKQQINQYAKLEEFIARETNMILQREKDNKKVGNYSQQLVRSKSKSSGGFYNNSELSSQNSQSSSLRREPKNLKNEKSITSFQYPEKIKDELQLSQRPRGKTVANLINQSIDEMESTKIKINSYLEKKQPSIKRSIQFPASAIVQKMSIPLVPNVLHILQPHRGPINSIIINSDGKRFLTASNDYTIKESTLDGTYNVLRKHQGRVNVLRMIDDKLYSGGNDCKLKLEKGSFTFQSPVVEIYPHQKEYINIGTSSTIQLFNLTKKISTKKIEVKTKLYKIHQKINKDVYFVDNHHLSVIDWRVPYPLINLLEEPNFVEEWFSDPYSLDFYQLKDHKLLQVKINNTYEKSQQHIFEEDVKDCCWKKDKVYFLTKSEIQIFQTSRNTLKIKGSYYLDQNISSPSKLQIKNDICIYGMLNGHLVVNKFN